MARGGNQKTTAEARAARAAKQLQALELKLAGATYEQIAKAVGYANEGGAWKAVDAALKGITRERAEAVKQMELERLDRLLLGIWAKAKAGNPQLIDRALRIMERRARLLGLDAPTKQTITIIPEDAIDAEIKRLAEQLAEDDTQDADEADADV